MTEVSWDALPVGMTDKDEEIQTMSETTSWLTRGNDGKMMTRQPESANEEEEEEAKMVAVYRDVDILKNQPADEMRKQRGIPFLLILSTVSVTLGGSILFGFNVAVLSVPSVHVKGFFNESHYQRNGVHLEEHSERWLWSFAVALFCLGAATGALISSYPSNRFGRKVTLIGNNVFSILGALLMSLSFFAHSYEMVMIGRFLAGVNVGIITAVVPMYLSEISPIPVRGLISIMHGALINIGVAFAQALGLYAFTGANSWPWLLGLPIILISLFQATSFLFCPESPRWLLINKQDPKSATRALKRLRDKKDVTREIREMEDESLRECSRETVGIIDLLTLRKPEWKKPLIITLVCNCCVNLTGINAIWFYLVEIFQSAGLTPSQIGIVTVWLGIGNAVICVMSGYLFDRFGRRPVIIGPLIACVVILCSLTVCMLFQSHSSWLPWLSTVLVACHTFAVTAGPGAAPFVFCTEIWSQAPRGAAMAIGSQVSWIMNFIVGILFPTMQDALGPYSFLVFAVILAGIVIYFWIELPETKNKSFEEIADLFKQKTGLDEKDHVINVYATVINSSSLTQCEKV